MAAGEKEGEGEGEAVVVLVLVLLDAVAVDEVLDAPELLHVAGDADGALLVEAELLLRLLEEALEQRVVDVHHWDHEPLPLLSLPHHNPHAPLGHIPQFLPQTLVAVAVAVVEEVEVETDEMVGLLHCSHGISLTELNRGSDAEMSSLRRKRDWEEASVLRQVLLAAAAAAHVTVSGFQYIEVFTFQITTNR